MNNNNPKAVLFVLSNDEFKTLDEVRNYFNNIKDGGKPEHNFNFALKADNKDKRKKIINQGDLMLFLYNIKGDGKKIFASCRVSKETTKNSNSHKYFYHFSMDGPSLVIYEDGIPIMDIFKDNEYSANFRYKHVKDMTIDEIEGKLKLKKVDPIIREDSFNILNNLSNVLLQFRQVIFQGPPGTSKTWEAKKLTAHLLNVDVEDKDWESKLADKRFAKIKTNNTEGCWDIVQFHPSYNYEDFVRGIQIKPMGSSGMKYEAVNRIICNMAEAAKCVEEVAEGAEEKNKKNLPPFILIIDEINRANLAAVLGELIYALEYRGEDVSSPYAINDDHAICIPKNFYIIGTMNTADRSVGHIDYAIRRRFAFETFLPCNSKLDRFYDELQAGKNIKGPRECAKKLFVEIEKLFSGGNLSLEFNKDDVQIGHTYFMAESEEKLLNKFIYQVYPILREYYKDGVFTSSGERLNIPGLKIEICNPAGNDIIWKKLQNFCSQKQVPTTDDDVNNDSISPEQQNGEHQEDIEA